MDWFRPQHLLFAFRFRQTGTRIDGSATAQERKSARAQERSTNYVIYIF